jgi:hypothetical protein
MRRPRWRCALPGLLGEWSPGDALVVEKSAAADLAAVANKDLDADLPAITQLPIQGTGYRRVSP